MDKSNMQEKKYFTGILVVIILAIILGGISITLMNFQTPNTQNVFLDESFNLHVDEKAYIDSIELVVTFLNVKEDSRCPSDVVCVWEGDVAIEVNIILNGQNRGNFELNRSNLHKASFGGYYLKLIELNPYPSSSEPIPLSSYNANFKVGQYGPDKIEIF
ncbi:MAG: hypothetical protein ACFFDI_07570 [Promethearchaeota archaeon]